METIIALIGVALVPIGIVALLPRNKEFFNKGIVRGFGLGVYLMLTVVLMMEALEEGGSVKGISWFLIGIFASLLIGFWFKEFHHHHSEEEASQRHNKSSMFRILVSDFFHNIVDGMAIIVGFAINPVVGIISFLGVLGHQVIQQIGQHILLIESGATAKKAIGVSLVVALSIFLGFALKGNELEAVLLALSAGIVAWKVWTDLIHTVWDKKIATGFVSGALILAIILLSVPHAHHEEEDEDHIEEEGVELLEER